MDFRKTVLITGANGLLGQNLAAAYCDAPKLVMSDLHPASAVSPAGNSSYVQADLADSAQVQNLVHAAKPDLILHAAAMTNVDACEDQPQAAHKANVTATQNLVSASPDGSRFIYLSTDYVFDGRNGPYREEDSPNPLGVYGKTKLEGERVVSALPDFLIVRTIVLYGTGRNLRPLFPDWILGKLSAGEPFRVVDDQTGNTTLASNLARICRALGENARPGLYHAAGAGMLSRFEFARAVARTFGFPENLISPCKTSDISQKAPRPLRSGFILDKVRDVAGVELLEISEQLARYKEEKRLG